MRIAIAHNEVTESSLPDEQDVLVQVEAVSGALLRLGHQPVPLPCNLDLAGLKLTIRQMRPECIFNLVESLDGRGQLIFLVPSLFDAMGVEYTGSPSASIHLTSHKGMAKEKMRAAGLPTPSWIGPYPHELCSKYSLNPAIPWSKGPWIIKSVWEHASIGLTGDGLVIAERPEDLMERMRLRAPELAGACFAEEYIDGREFNLSILAGPDGPQVLPVAEIMFEGYQENKAHIVCYKAKWDEQSFEYSHTPRRFDFPLEDTPLLKELEKLAIGCWRIFGLKGYARVDFRVDKEGRPFILEVNANPCLSPDAGFAAAVLRSGMSFDRAVECILNDVTGKMETMMGFKPDSQPFSISDAIFRYEPCRKDIDEIRRIVVATGFFHPYEVDVAIELVEERLLKGLESEYYFVFLEKAGSVIGYSCYGPIPCTASSFDLYWIAVDPVYQRMGAGKMILEETERLIRKAGGTRIYVDTSQSETYNTTRAFYQQCGYRFESVLEDFYGPGDGKVVCCKVLSH